MEVKDLIGQRFERLTVMSRASNTSQHKTAWLCRCDCGVQKIVTGAHLKKGTKSCGCANPNRKIDLAGTTVGLLTVLRPVENKGVQTAWLCLCSCGKETIMTTGSLRGGLVKSCGCYRNARNKNGNFIHGLSSKRLYRTWIGMKSRCLNSNLPCYYNYGGRGIKVCSEWMDFLAFYAWAMSHGYRDDLTIERKRNSEGYSPENCTWIPKPQQSYNLRTNRMIRYNGQTKSIHEWSAQTGIPVASIRSRLDIMQWPVDRALTLPNKTKVRHERKNQSVNAH